MNHAPTLCCLCEDQAVAVWYMPHGCIARPGLTVQPLCEHHERKATPLAGMEMIKDLRVGKLEEA